MTPGRNDPCPCGSGRKYKQCCGGRRNGPAGRGSVEEQVLATAAEVRTWDVEAVPVLVGVSDGTSPRPVGLLVLAGGFIVGYELLPRLSGDPVAVAGALEGALVGVARRVGTFPRDVRVRHEDVARALASRLESRQVSVAAAEELPELEEAAVGLMERLAGRGMWPPIGRSWTWEGWDLPPSVVSKLFAAAASFWKEAPWRTLANLQAPRARLPSGREWTTCVLGNGGEEFGLVLYSDADDLFERFADASPEDAFGSVRGRLVALMYERVSDLPREARREALRARWDVASPDAYPILMTVNTPGGGVSTEDARDLIALLRAIPPFVGVHRHRFLEEARGNGPASAVRWTHSETGVALCYAGEGAKVAAEPGVGSTSVLPELPDDLRERLDAAVEETAAEMGPDADPEVFMEAVGERLAARTDEYNQAPQPDLGGLSPAQVHRLLSSDWSASGPVRLRRDLDGEELGGSALLADARALLSLACDRGQLGVTQAGNLQVAVVRDLLDVLELAPEVREALRGGARRVTEADVPGLHRLRVLLELAGLLDRRGRRFEPTTTGRELLVSCRPGELYARLFETSFRRFNLAYDTMWEWPELQYQSAFTLYRLGRLGTGWHTAAELVRETVLPFALDRAPRGTNRDLPALVFAFHILDTLAPFGLVEEEPRGYAPAAWTPPRYRVKPLLGRFLHFDI